MAEERAAQLAAEEAARRARRDAIWAPMYAERARRALTAVLPEPQGIHRLALDGSGFISVIELAARVEERRRMRKALRLNLLEPTVVREEQPDYSEESEVLQCA